MHFKHYSITALVVSLIITGSSYSMQHQQGTIHTLPTNHSINPNQLELMKDSAKLSISTRNKERKLYLIAGATCLAGSLVSGRFEYSTISTACASASGINLAFAIRAHLKLKKDEETLAALNTCTSTSDTTLD